MHVISDLRKARSTIRPTTIIESVRLSKRLNAEVVIASETFQHTGSFKFRAAFNLALNVQEDMILTESSGNFGQALAYACQILGKKCIVVMPSTSARVKIDAVRSYGGTVELTDVTVKTRRERLLELVTEHPEAYVASAFDNDFVIAGNSTLGEELVESGREFDFVIAPVGGGGLTSGLVQGLKRLQSPAKVIGAEPLLANDAARSLRAGEIVRNEQEPQTLADGARVVCIGERNWEILRIGIHRIVEVTEDQICEALQLLFSLANLKCEPTGALSIGALLADPQFFSGKRICCVISGGNVDLAGYTDLLNRNLCSH
jgi:threonine dehydratase